MTALDIDLNMPPRKRIRSITSLILRRLQPREEAEEVRDQEMERHRSLGVGREMMKRAREEEKFSGPLFPRLHVNDANKGSQEHCPGTRWLYMKISASLPSDSRLDLPLLCCLFLIMVVAWSLQSPLASDSSTYMLSQIPSSLSYDRQGVGLKKKPFKPVSQGAVTVECSSPLPRVTSTEKQPPNEKSEEEQFHVPVYLQQKSELASDPDRHMAEGPQSSCISMNKNQNGEGISDHDAGNLSEGDRDLGRSSDDSEPCDEDKCGSSGSTRKTSLTTADDQFENRMMNYTKFRQT